MVTDCLCEDELKASRRNKGLKEAVQDHFQTQPEHLIFSISISSCKEFEAVAMKYVQQLKCSEINVARLPIVLSFHTLLCC